MLVYPPFSQPVDSKKRCLVPLGLAYIAAYLRNHGVEVAILDCVVEGYEHDEINGKVRTFGLPWEEIKKRIKRYRPQFVGVSCLMTAQRHNALKICKLVKEISWNIHTVLGGIHPSVFPKEMIRNSKVDSVVIGEGEQAMLDIVMGNLAGIVQRDILNIDDIPWPARDLLPMSKYFQINMPENIFSPNNRVTQVITSRGCPFKCSFCATTRFHGKWRGRKFEDVIEEIKYLIDHYSIDEVNFIDENLVVDKTRTENLMHRLKPLKIAWSNPGGIWIGGLDNYILKLMKESGCYQLTFPVESSNERILKDVINKPLDPDIVKPLVDMCHKLKIDVHAFFIEGFPEQTKQDMINDYHYAKKINFDSVTFLIITPLPGSCIYEKYKDNVDLDNINYIYSTIPHPTMSAAEIESTVHMMNVRFNKRWKWRHPIKFIRKYILLPRKKMFSDPYQRI